jgi:CrcB protein
MIQAVLLVMAGGAAGSAARYVLSHITSDLSRQFGFPLGTLLVNLLGSFVVGYVLASWMQADDRWRLFLATGICGGFTTFSTFSYETIGYWQNGRWFLMCTNIVLNNALSLAATALAMHLHQES